MESKSVLGETSSDFCKPDITVCMYVCTCELNYFRVELKTLPLLKHS